MQETELKQTHEDFRQKFLMPSSAPGKFTSELSFDDMKFWRFISIYFINLLFILYFYLT